MNATGNGQNTIKENPHKKLPFHYSKLKRIKIKSLKKSKEWTSDGAGVVKDVDGKAAELEERILEAQERGHRRDPEQID